MMQSPVRFAGHALLLAIFLIGPAKAEESSPAELFNQRIMPIFRSPQPSSCVQCHLASVDLKKYILPSHEKTFLSLRDQGLIDLDTPAKSKILTLIRMGEKDLDKGAQLIHEKTRKAEYEAFAGWIKACCADPKLRELPALSPGERAAPDRPNEVIRHARKSRVVDSFVRNIWSQRMRCFPCHTPHEVDPANPKHQAAVKTLRQFKEKFDDQLLERLPIFRETPEATLKYLVTRSQQTKDGELPLINLENPRESLLVLKPMSKLPKKRENGEFESPSSARPTTHLGGLKMHPDDQSYKSFVAWLQDYANVVGNRYKSAEELPADNWFGSNLVLRVRAAPEAWQVGTPVQMFVHAWNDAKQEWTQDPVAFTQGTVTPRRIVNGALFLFGPKYQHDQQRPPREKGKLPRGRYLVKVHVDANGRLAKDATLLLGDEEFVGQGVIKNARWREGFRFAESISAKQLEKTRAATP